MSLKPRLTSALNNLGTILLEEGQYLKAKSLLIRANKIDPQYLNSYYNLAVIKFKTKNGKR